MIGQVVKITKFGLFVSFREEQKDQEFKSTGLLRWSSIPKGTSKIQVNDFISVDIEKVQDDGKISLKLKNEDFKALFGQLLTESSEKIENLQLKNASLLKK